jgi:hypothetical protein
MRAHEEMNRIMWWLVAVASIAWLVLIAAVSANVISTDANQMIYEFDAIGILLGLLGGVGALAMCTMFALGVRLILDDQTLSPVQKRRRVFLMLLFNGFAGYIFAIRWLWRSRHSQSRSSLE